MTSSATDLTAMTLAGLAEQIREKNVSPLEVTHAFVERIRTLEPTLGAFITRMEEQALEAARHAEAEIAAGRYKGPLHGIPVGIKDIIDTAGVRTTSGSLIDAERVPERDATAVRLLKEAGASVIGKTHTVEFAFSPTGANEHYGTPKNPWGFEHLPGGSSSGSGVA
ncbi:MAG: amidase, partial [Dehalococcoidia bacterium]